MDSQRPKLVILGTGFASFSLVKEIDVHEYEVVIVSPRNHFLFTPLLPSTTVGTVEFRSIIEPIRIARKGITFHQAECADVDLDTKTLHCKGAFRGTPFTMNYDALVIGVGAVSNTFGIPGVEQHAMFLKELADARAIRQKIIENFERASQPRRSLERKKQLLHFVVVGGGPTGVEFAAEMHDFATQDLAKWFPDLSEHIRITVLEATGAILTSFDKKLGGYALRHFEREGIEVRTNAFVEEVQEEQVVLSHGETIKCGLVVWSTGVGPTGLIEQLKAKGVATDKQSRILTDDYFRIPGVEDVYAIGDCARIDGQDLPPTAQVAQQEGHYLAGYLNKRARHRDAEQFHYKHMGMMAYIGNQRALADMRNVKSKGFGTWLLWRSAYLTKLVSFKNKVLVFGDWLHTWVFGRDISRF